MHLTGRLLILPVQACLCPALTWIFWSRLFQVELRDPELSMILPIVYQPYHPSILLDADDSANYMQIHHP